MEWWRALGGLAACSLALFGAAPSGGGSAPTVVMLTRDGGFVPHHAVVWFTADGVARRDARDPGHEAHMRAPVSYAYVARVATDADLCERTPKFASPGGSDVPVYRLSVRCGEAWRIVTSYGVELGGDERVRTAVTRLLRLAESLAWAPEAQDVPPPLTTPALSKP